MSMDVNGCQWHRLFNFLSTRWLIKPKSPQPWAVLVLNRWHGAAHLEDLLFGGRQMSKNACSSTVEKNAARFWRSPWTIEPMALKKTHSIHSCVSKWGTLNSSRVSLFYAFPRFTICKYDMPFCLESLVVLSQWSHHLWTASSAQSRWNLLHFWQSKSEVSKVWHSKGIMKRAHCLRSFCNCFWCGLSNLDSQLHPTNTKTSTQTIPPRQPLVFSTPKKKCCDQSLVQRVPCSTSQEFADAGSDLRVLKNVTLHSLHPSWRIPCDTQNFIGEKPG